MTNQGVQYESHETQISTGSVRDDLGLAHLRWQRDHLDDLSDSCQDLLSVIL